MVNYWFSGLHKISKFYHILFNSITFVSKATYLIMNWEIDKFTGTNKFSKIVIFVGKLRFWQQIQLDCASFEMTSSLCSFARKTSAKWPSVKNQCACPLFFQVKMVIHKKSSSQPKQSHERMHSGTWHECPCDFPFHHTES